MTTSEPPTRNKFFSLETWHQPSFGVQDQTLLGDILTTMMKYQTKSSPVPSIIRNTLTTYTRLGEQDNIKEKKLNIWWPSLIGSILTIRQSIFTGLAPQKHQKNQRTTILQESSNYCRKQKQLSPQLSRNSKQSVDQLAQPHIQEDKVPQP